MYTDCPGCHRQFHIYATQISAARGQVKCGFCGLQFDALERLHDQPRPRPPAEFSVAATKADLPEPEFIIPEEDRKPPHGVPAALPGAGGTAPGSAARAGAKTPPAPVMDAAKTDAGAARVTRGGHPGAGLSMPGLTQAPADPGATRPVTMDYSGSAPVEQVPQGGRQSRLLWGMGMLLLLIFGMLQITWFNRDTIMSRYPQTVPWFTRLCATIACGYVRNRDLSAIHLLNRDVRHHPRYQGALLVNATMSNQSQTLQPYPLIQLNLFDTGGKLVAYRQFQPREYLDDSIDITLGMTPGVPVHFVLEVLDSVAGAVSFEFEFH